MSYVSRNQLEISHILQQIELALEYRDRVWFHELCEKLKGYKKYSRYIMKNGQLVEI